MTNDSRTVSIVGLALATMLSLPGAFLASTVVVGQLILFCRALALLFTAVQSLKVTGILLSSQWLTLLYVPYLALMVSGFLCSVDFIRHKKKPSAPQTYAVVAGIGLIAGISLEIKFWGQPNFFTVPGYLAATAALWSFACILRISR